MTLRDAAGVSFEISVPVAIVGAGACGLTAALAAADRGVEALVIERDPVPSGSTALSSGMIPACGTALQAAAGVEDSVELFAGDIQRKAHGRADLVIVDTVCRESGPAIDWLVAEHGLDLVLVQDFLYPGHSVARMHAPPSKTGAELSGMLQRAAAAKDIDILTDAVVTVLYVDGDTVHGLEVTRPDGVVERIGCDVLVLACNGYAGNRDMLAEHIPEMLEAEFSGHAGNRGDAVKWGRALGAAVRHMGAYQGHGSVASPHGALITWGIMMEGGIQVNAEGRRFSNEHQGYSEQAVPVLQQPGHIAWDVFDDRLLALGRGFEDFRDAEQAGAVRTAADEEELARIIGCDAATLGQTLDGVAAMARGTATDPFGRDFTTKPALVPPYHAIKVTGSLFHTQGGLVIDEKARVLREDGTPLPNLYAGGGAACGVSGPTVDGYLSGNGLLTAVTLGRIAGREAG